ncbi:SGNH/GDSL hydrolase family protein [Rhizobium rhizoryzae]|uniref:SGNH/GDSL hydrolase family protein n=1 Tax=Rhizobium rhizoryzae TaxID=451876 RepID=UPI0028A1555C|nr:GDSL-type esterase/lipase family protein [Rhizobium rhizoryzae]
MTSKRRLPRRLLTTALIAVMALPAGVGVAQEQRRTLFDMLFGNERRRPESSIIQMRPRPERVRPQGAARPAAPTPVKPPAAAPQPEAVEKMDSARKILVVGDFGAMGVGQGLETAFEQDPSVKVIAKGSVASGLVRQDHYDWLSELPRMLEQEKPQIVVVMLGANDRQSMQVGAERERFRTDIWLKEYEERVTRLAKMVTDRKIPLLWVGLAAFESPSLTADAVTLNGIYRSNVEEVGGEFVDIWDGFVDESGQFIVTGSDVNGQPARLRGADGVSFTDAGKRKLAFYVEKLAKRHLGDLSVGDLIRLDAGDLPLLSSLPPEVEAKMPSQPINLSDPELDGGKELLGASTIKPVARETPQNLLLTKGFLPDAPVGRIDNVRLNPTSP